MSKILIVEDEESIAELEKDYLELSGFEVEIENDGEAGLKRAISEEFDLFILDLMLPGVDGFEICKTISIRSAALVSVLTTILQSRSARARWWRESRPTCPATRDSSEAEPR